MKKILITGANSYIGDSVKAYLLQWPQEYDVIVKDTIGWEVNESDFYGIDVVFNVAGIAHIKETDENRHLYYEINRDLVIRIAETAKRAGVKQFVALSTMSVYGLTVGHITKKTPVNPTSAYGISKEEADSVIAKMTDKDFKFACLRPPMVYGKGCKGNYQRLRLFALRFPFFPKFSNQRSMVFIGNLCAFVKEVIDQEKNGLFFPQNSDYVETSKMVKLIAENNNRHIRLVRVFNWLIKILPVNVIRKVFGDLTYEKVDTIDAFDFETSIRLTEEL